VGRKPGTDVFRRKTGEHPEDETFPGLLLLRAEGRRCGGERWLAALNPEVLRVVQRSPLGRALGRERMFFTLQHAVERFQAVTPGAGP